MHIGEMGGCIEEEVDKYIRDAHCDFLPIYTDGSKQDPRTGRTSAAFSVPEYKVAAHQLEQRDKQLKKQDTLYREQVTKLEERGKRFYSAITESYQKASWEVSAKFRHYQINPVCADLQREVLKCYRENSGQTLSCSQIASLYLQCVSEARQSKMGPGD
ncbi:hypothetical protein SKAU_G00093030 [Synaphobranchus kaupii]|uniref:MICOS complex subunit MIC19 n=1 Tax=Synaphobranchus kaupii TaxID=118154 RepID=A0A9Q1FX24_SYNKA|nr:hypothetical protein SKAU_G00093030 [Synaphobranchus kaupii]